MKEIIGEIIKEEVRKQGLTQEQFSSMMNMSLRTTANLFNKEHLPHDQLITASKVLKKDFVREYINYLYDNNPDVKKLDNINGEDAGFTKPAKIEHEITLQVNIYGKMEKIETEFSGFLRTMKKEAETRGLHIG